MPIPMNVTSQQQDRRLSLTHSQYPHDEMQSMPQQSAHSSEVQVESSQSGSRKSSRPPSADGGSRLKRKLSAQELKDQIQKEIEELQQAQARLEAEAKETKETYPNGARLHSRECQGTQERGGEKEERGSGERRKKTH